MPSVSALLAIAGTLLGIAGRPPALGAQSPVWALVNARIEPVRGPIIERGVILIREGLIEAIGTGLTIPPDARVLDLGGRTVSPGIIDLASTLGGAPPAQAAAAGRTGPAPTPAGRPEGLDPSRSAALRLELAPADLRAAREAGITAVLVAPSRGALRGQSAVVPTRDSAGPAHVLRSPAAMHFGFQGAQGQYPATLLGVIAYTRQTLYDAQRYALVSERFRTDPRGVPRPELDPGLDALVPVLRGSVPAFFAASNENEIRRAARIAGEFGLRLTVVGATEGWRALDALAGRQAVVSVNFPRSPEVTGWTYRLTGTTQPPDSATADRDARPLIEGNAAALHRAGVRLALGSGGLRPGEFLPAVRKAIAAGLPAAAALEALTLVPAEMVGLSAALGTIEPGKIANLVVTEGGGLLADSARIRHVFVDGIRYDIAAPAPGRGNGGGPPVALGGTWVLTINSPQGPMDVTMTVTQSGGSFSGSMTSMLGTTSFDDGQIDGRSASWSMTIQMGGNAMTLTYQAQVDGTRMTGSVSLGQFGNAPFTGEKRP